MITKDNFISIVIMTILALSATNFLMHLAEQRDKHSIEVSACIHNMTASEQFRGTHRQAWELFYIDCTHINHNTYNQYNDGVWTDINGNITGYSLTEDSLITNTPTK